MNTCAPPTWLPSLDRADHERICADVDVRLRGLLFHWHDRATRDTILFPCLEQAVYYQPVVAPVTVRALVVAAIRNSILEDLGSPSLESAEPRISLVARELKAITMPAVTYWAAQNLGSAVLALPAPVTDPFADLGQRFPRAWAALQALATSRAPIVRFELPTAPIPALPAFTARESWISVLSGMNPRLDDGLVATLHRVAGDASWFYADSWKAITRDIGKLCFVIDVVLAHGKSVVTSNYLLTPTQASRRTPLLKPGHYVSEMKENARTRMGLTSTHARLLKMVARSFA